MNQIRLLFYKIKNAIKYSIKKNVTTDELYMCNSLAHIGYMGWRTYGKVVGKEAYTRIRNEN